MLRCSPILPLRRCCVVWQVLSSTERLTLTGQLGDVMKESSTAALTYIRANTGVLGVSSDFIKDREVHIHVPEGAIPKDGPSAGITMAVAVISAASGIPVRADVAMTGEITLRGRILPIGGLTEKLLAAQRIGITRVIIPKENQRDLIEIPKQVLEGLEICPVENLSEAVPLVFRSAQLSSEEKNNGTARTRSTSTKGSRKSSKKSSTKGTGRKTSTEKTGRTRKTVK